ncbi:hypothetical protein AVEN_138383-1 [Araneus ventricosus]|uniref:Uncharacterized protein n=1 Tax=Araneus ventricosus TaxID=182803 RepID=A0A4Y2N7Y2_ARAVE|nr:hypothetical protein AVEN_181893-1 [Araneus ventricosus]GBN72628.1 hypothetical protein AVEN_238362-1 [Araneus ventricosus]GBN72657.1 hypothetical protein AVEN_138383-1 [Araneus ventricosus]
MSRRFSEKDLSFIIGLLECHVAEEILRTAVAWWPRLQDRMAPGSKHNSTKDLFLCRWALCTLNLTPRVKRPPAGVVRKLGEWPLDGFFLDV